MSEYKLEKTVSECYRISIPGSFAWATITINEVGDLNILSDYGSFSYAWRSFGKSFKEFLVRICDKCEKEPRGYLYSKLHDRHRASMVECEETVKQFKIDLFNSYREKKRDFWYMEKDKKAIYPRLENKVRDAYDSLCSIESEGTMSLEAFSSAIWHDSNLSDELFGEEYFVYANIVQTGDTHCAAFCKEIAPVFAKILREELEQQVADAQGQNEEKVESTMQ